MTEAERAELLEAQHAVALRLAASMRDRSADDQRVAIKRWRDIARDIHKAALRARRQLRERARQARLRNGALHNDGSITTLIIDGVIAGIEQAAGRELADADIATATTARDEAARYLREETSAAWCRLRLNAMTDAEAVVAAFQDKEVRAVGASVFWVAALIGYAHQRGEYLSGIHAVGLLGVGKTDAITRIAALALAELGNSSRDVANTLDIDQALARRLTRPARTS